jgi:hypothetical protein
MAIRAGELELVERVLFGVLSLGMPPSRAAGDDTFRVDHVVAVSTALCEDEKTDVYLREDGVRVQQAFRDRLRASIESLGTKELVTTQPAEMPTAPGGFDPGLAVDLIDPDEHPVVLDRSLAQECLETLLQDKRLYSYLMDRYAKSGEVWRRLRDEGQLS